MFHCIFYRGVSVVLGQSLVVIAYAINRKLRAADFLGRVGNLGLTIDMMSAMLCRCSMLLWLIDQEHGFELSSGAVLVSGGVVGCPTSEVGE